MLRAHHGKLGLFSLHLSVVAIMPRDRAWIVLVALLSMSGVSVAIWQFEETVGRDRMYPLPVKSNMLCGGGTHVNNLFRD